MLKFWFNLLLPFTVVSSSIAADTVDLSFPITCVFQFGQYMDARTAKSDTQKATMEWNFINLLGSEPTFLSGGDTGSILVHQHPLSSGVSIWLKQGNGAQLFSIWTNGTAFWSKHNDLLGSKASQQFRGTCTNIRKTNY
jgi:hypothetical protein